MTAKFWYFVVCSELPMRIKIYISFNLHGENGMNVCAAKVSLWREKSLTHAQYYYNQVSEHWAINISFNLDFREVKEWTFVLPLWVSRSILL